MNVAVVTVGAYDNAGVSIKGPASRREEPCAGSIPAASTSIRSLRNILDRREDSVQVGQVDLVAGSPHTDESASRSEPGELMLGLLELADDFVAVRIGGAAAVLGEHDRVRDIAWERFRQQVVRLTDVDWFLRNASGQRLNLVFSKFLRRDDRSQASQPIVVRGPWVHRHDPRDIIGMHLHVQKHDQRAKGLAHE
ncbi:MAG TPA: hypothetical protein VIU81_00470 [Gaiellaceae bacterium]